MICRKRNCNVGVFVGLLSLCPGDRELTGTEEYVPCLNLIY